MKHTRWLTAAALGCLVFLAGCAPKVEGKWQTPTTMQGISVDGTIDFKKDKTFAWELVFSAANEQVPVSISGTWRSEKKDKKRLLTMEMKKATLQGREVPPGLLQESTQTFEIAFEKDKMTLKDISGVAPQMTFTRTK